MTLAPEENMSTLPEGPTEELQPGTPLLHGQYRIERFLNSGGFGLTYLARDSLDRVVVIKECFPESLCVRTGQDVRARSRSHNQEFDSIVRLFIEEAHRLARLDHPGIVGVHQVFADNTTAYMALDYVEGKNLLEIIEDPRERPSPAQVTEILVKLLEAIAFVHDQSLLHRDISPDNILIDRRGNPVLIDFGAARERATRTSRVLSRLQVVKDGYSPQEFYVAGIRQGPPSDLYALAATFYHLIAGEAPHNSQVRMAALAANEPDPYVPLVDRIEGYPTPFLSAIDRALKVIPKERPQTAHEWLSMIGRGPDVTPVAGRAELDPVTRDVIARLVEETNRAVMDAHKRGDTGHRRKVAETPQMPARKSPFTWRSLYDDDDVPAHEGQDVVEAAMPPNALPVEVSNADVNQDAAGFDHPDAPDFDDTVIANAEYRRERRGGGLFRGGLFDGIASRFMARP